VGEKWLDCRFVTGPKDLEAMLAERPAGDTDIAIRAERPRDGKQVDKGVGRLAVKSFAKLARFKKLAALWLSYVEPTPKALAELAEMKIRRLNIERCQIDSWDWIAPMSELTQLEISICGLDDLTPFAGLVGLKVLRVFTNKVSDLTPIAPLVNLEELDVGWNEPLELGPVAGMKKLKSLRANGSTTVKSLAPLDNLTKLKEVIVDAPARERKRFAALRPKVELKGSNT
jgi:hypothetical protein